MQLRNATLAVALVAGLAAPAQGQRGFRLTAGPEVEAAQRAVLMELFNATDGLHWKHKDRWGSDEPVCTWAGVSCQWLDGSSEGLIRHLGLGENRLRGTLPASLSKLFDLVSLDVSGNELTGEFPASLLQRVDDNQMTLEASGNAFANFLSSVTLKLQAITGMEHDGDVNLLVTLDARRGRATYQGQRFDLRPNRKQGTYCLAAEGPVPDMVYLSRALRHLGFIRPAEGGGRPDGGISDHDTVQTLELTWGNGTTGHASIISGLAPIRTKIAWSLITSTIPADWAASAKRVDCKRFTWLPW